MAPPAGSSTQTAAQTASRAAKARTKLLLARSTYDYQYIFAGIVGFLVIRNIVLATHHYLSRRRKFSLQASVSNSEKGSGTTTTTPSTRQQPFIVVRAFLAFDAWAGRSVGRPLGADWTWSRFLLTAAISAVNTGFCLADLHWDAGRSAIVKVFSERIGRIAVINFPILYALAGRNNLVSFLTGIAYQEVRFYHKVLGRIVFLESFIHTFAFIGFYLQGTNPAKLQEEYSELYFKMGIVAMVGATLLFVFSLRWMRGRWYELFLILHVLGAAMMLAGMWYHRPICVNWVYAATALWVFERVTRIVRHLSGLFHSRLILRRPLLQANATVCHGAILLHIPFPTGTWSAGQHCYLSFWGTDLLKKPWLYGQTHPFSISNIPRSAPRDDHELRFVLRIKDGITRALANHILASDKRVGEGAKVTVSVEGPYGHDPRAEEYDSVLLVAGGSGITHASSILATIAQKAVEKHATATQVRLVWAIHHLNQAAWIDTTLEEVRTAADVAGLDLRIDLFVTRPDTFSASSSQDGQEDRKSEEEFVKEKSSGSSTLASLPRSRAVVHSGRPEVTNIMREVVAHSPGRSFVVACGPTELANVVRSVAGEIASPDLDIEIASFEC